MFDRVIFLGTGYDFFFWPRSISLCNINHINIYNVYNVYNLYLGTDICFGAKIASYKIGNFQQIIFKGYIFHTRLCVKSLTKLIQNLFKTNCFQLIIQQKTILSRLFARNDQKWQTRSLKDTFKQFQTYDL